MNIFPHKVGQFLLAAVVFSAILVGSLVSARADTWPLSLNKIKSPGEAGANEDLSPLFYDYRFLGGSQQNFQAQVGPPGQNRVEWPGMAEQAAEFKKIVKKEPAYKCDYPFRGVADLGAKKFAFALDALPPEPKAENADAKQAKKDGADSPDKKTQPSKKKLFAYNRLYFDFNGNGDLTDDKVVSVESQASGEATNDSETVIPDEGLWVSFQFPSMEVPLEVEGAKFDYSCGISGYLSKDEGIRYATVSLRTSAYREGEITLEGKKWRVVLIDANCNGRFDDAAAVQPSGAKTQPLRLVDGDTLIIKPLAEGKEKEDNSVRVDWYSENYDENSRRISKWVNIDNRCYELKIPPAGDKITLNSVEVAMGNITNPNDGFSATIYSDKAILKISGNKDTPVPVPVGRWKLLSYKIDRTKLEEAEKPEKKPEKPKQSIMAALGKSLLSTGSGMLTPTFPARHDTYVEANATSAYQEVEVSQGKTVVLPFGPPYKPQVEAGYYDVEKKTMRLSLSLVGSAGEICSDLEIKGGRPSKPEFTITDPQGKVVDKGAFEYG